MHRRERHFAFLNDNRIVHPFGWGVEFIKENANGDRKRVRQLAAWSGKHAGQVVTGVIILVVGAIVLAWLGLKQ